MSTPKAQQPSTPAPPGSPRKPATRTNQPATSKAPKPPERKPATRTQSTRAATATDTKGAGNRSKATSAGTARGGNGSRASSKGNGDANVKQAKQRKAKKESGAREPVLKVAPASARQTTTEASAPHLYTLPDYFPPPRDQTQRGRGAWKTAYLAALIESAGHVGRALAIVDISRPTLQRARETDEEFREAERQARQQAAEVLRDEVIRRAVHGVRRYKFLKNGDPILHPVTGEYYYEHEYSDQLATVLLKGAYPEEFADRQKIQHEATVRTQIFASRQERKEALEAAKAAAKLPT